MLPHTVPAGTAADGCDAARVVSMTAPAQNNLPQAQQRRLTQTAGAASRKLMPSARLENAPRWPRREAAAGLASARTDPSRLSQSGLRACVQALRTVPRSDLPQALRRSMLEPRRALLAAAAALGAGGFESSSAEPPEKTSSKSRMKSDTTGAPEATVRCSPHSALDWSSSTNSSCRR